MVYAALPFFLFPYWVIGLLAYGPLRGWNVAFY